VERRLTDFQERYNTTARPFQWKFTTTDRADFLERLEQRPQTDTTTPAQSRAA